MVISMTHYSKIQSRVIYANGYCICLYIYHRCKESGKQLALLIYVKDRYANGNCIDKLTKWYQ